jgi:hypothetical protein
MVEVDPNAGAVTPYPDAAWNSFSEQGDGSPLTIFKVKLPH